MNIIGKWKVRELLFPADGGTVSYTPDNLPEGDCADEIIMMLTNRIEFTEDGLMNTLMRVPEDKIELAKSRVKLWERLLTHSPKYRWMRTDV